MHQGSGLSPLLFVIVMEAISREFRIALPWELVYADDLAVIAETEEELIKRLNEWKENVESKGMRVNMNKTKVALVNQRLDYGKSTLVGIPAYLMCRLQSALNAAARLIFHLRRSDHILSLIHI